jgi:hypothetical protein
MTEEDAGPDPALVPSGPEALRASALPGDDPGQFTITPSTHPIKAGDKVTMDVTMRRRWWQVWKPRQWTERRSFVVQSLLCGGNP